MIDLQKRTGTARAFAETETVGLILRLWGLRRQLPVERLPLAGLDEVEATLARLAPGRRAWAYFDAFSAETEPSTEMTEASIYLKNALHIDRIAGDLVHGLIARAAGLAEADGAAWVTQAAQIGDETLLRVRRVRSDPEDGRAVTESHDWSSEVKKRATELSLVVSALVAALEVEALELPNQAQR